MCTPKIPGPAVQFFGFARHPSESWDPAFSVKSKGWIPAFAGMTSNKQKATESKTR
jgi:hypothetical protein